MSRNDSVDELFPFVIASERRERGNLKIKEYMYYVYILTNRKNTVLYVGVTNNLEKRIAEHKQRLIPNSFTARYNVDKLVYYETTTDVKVAIEREKQLKSGSRKKKLDLIESINSTWEDLSNGI